MISRDTRYNSWILLNEPRGQELVAQKTEKFDYAPKISVVVPVYNPRAEFLDEMIKSVLEQTYSNWELCLADGGSDEEIRQMMKRHAAADGRLKLIFLKENLGIAGNTNAAFGLATGEFVALMDHDDTIPPFALYEVIKLLNSKPGTDFIYSDQDSLSDDGKARSNPFFKPEWSPDYLRSCNYIAHLAVVRTTLLDAVGRFRDGFEGSQDLDLFLRIAEKTANIEHIPKILYHWRLHSASTALTATAKPYASQSGVKAVKEHLLRLGLGGDAEIVIPGFYRVSYSLKTEPLVSIIIPNKDNVKILKKCLDSIFGKTTYKNYEVIIVENNSEEDETFSFYKQVERKENVKIVKYQGSFNYSKINNFAASMAEGEVLLFLNNDTEVKSPDWMERMLGFTLRPDVGAVGALLLYPDNLVQHAGVLVGFRGAGGHYHTHSIYGETGYAGRLIVAHDVSAVTAACIMLRRTVFVEVGGFDEAFAVAFGDVDFCLKIRDKGYLIVFTPDARLYHHESKTRGYEDTPEKVGRFNSEVDLLRSRWKNVLEKGDPYYNPNFSMTEGVFVINAPGKETIVTKIIRKALDGSPGLARIYVKLRSPYRTNIRPRMIRLADFIFQKPETRQKIRFYYRKIFY